MLIWLRVRLVLTIFFALAYLFLAAGIVLFGDADGHRSFSTLAVAAAGAAALTLGAVSVWLIVSAARREPSQRAPQLARARQTWLVAGWTVIAGALAAATIGVIEWATGYQAGLSFIGVVALNAGIVAVLLMGLSRWIRRLTPTPGS